MRVPWSFIIALFLGLTLGIGVFIGFLYSQLGIPTDSTRWTSDIIQKKKHYAAGIPGPRLFLVGGSNALFGLNAQRIEQQTGNPTVNFGSHAGLGIDYLLDVTKRTVRPGDTVLLVLEYELYGGRGNSEQLDDYVLARDPDYFRRLSLPDKIDMATRIPFKRIQKGLRILRTPEHPRPPSLPYNPYTPITAGIDCLDENGDEIFNTPDARPDLPPRLKDRANVLVEGLPNENTHGFAVLAAFLDWAKANHITVLATWPNIIHQPVYDEPPGQQAVATIAHFYSTHGVPVVGTAAEAMLPTDQFFDTIYHLTHIPALERTDRLIPGLQPLLRPSK